MMKYKIILPIYFIFILLFTMNSQVESSNLTNFNLFGGAMTEQEEYIMRQIKEGKPADLLDKFVLGKLPEDEGLKNINELGLSGYLTYLENLGEKKRKDFLKKYANKLQIRSNFLEKLAIGGFPDLKSDRFSFLIANAMITGDLNFSDAEVNNSVILFGCVFDENVTFRDAFFKKHLFLNKVSFMKQADFHRLKVGRNLFLKKSVFHGVTDFGGLNVERDLNASEAQFLFTAKGTDFTGMEIGRNVFLSKAIFYGETDFLYAIIGGLLNADETKFLNTGIAANLKSIKVGREAFFRGAEFHGSTDFGGTDISGQFSAENAKFYNLEKKINFNNMKIAKSAFFRKTEFNGPVDFGGIEIGGELSIEGAKFLNIASFNSIRVFGHLFLRESSFLNDADFVSSNINGDFNAKFAKFKGTNRVLFNSITIGKNTFFDNSEFSGPVDFMHAHFNGLLTLQKAIFHSKESVNFNNAKVKGSAFFNGSIFNGELDLRFCDFSNLEFVGVNYKNINLEGMTYNDIYAGNDFKNLLALLDGSPYYAQPYKMLESFLNGQGHKEQADEVFIRGKDRELSERKWKISGFFYWALWGKLAGYGRDITPIFILSLIFILVGMVVFDTKDFSQKYRENWKWLNEGVNFLDINFWKSIPIRFGLSFDQFVPGSILGLAKEWDLSKLSVSILIYYYIHKIAGWILVPISLAALITRIK